MSTILNKEILPDDKTIIDITKRFGEVQETLSCFINDFKETLCNKNDELSNPKRVERIMTQRLLGLQDIERDFEVLEEYCIELFKGYVLLSKSQEKRLEELENELNQIKDPQNKTYRNVELDIKIAEDKNKIDIIKVIHALCNMNMFTKADDSKVNTQDVMDALGDFLHTDLKNYSARLNASKSASTYDHYMKIFDDIKAKAEKYYNK